MLPLHSSLRSVALIAAAMAFTMAGPAAMAQTPSQAQLDGITPRTIGPATMSGRFVDMDFVESNPSIFYAASSTGGVWKTVDGGVTWTDVFGNQATHSIGDVVVHQRDTAVVWVGTGERASRQSSSWGDGVYKSTDGGQSWRNMGLEDSHHIGRIRLHPDNPDIVFVAAMGHLWGPNEERGLYRSTDGGETWRRVLHVDAETGVVDVILSPDNPDVVFAASYQRQRRPWGFHGGGPGSALWKSTDGGDTWTKLTNAGLDNGLPSGDIGRIGIDIYRADPRIVYISVEQGERYNASTAYEQRLAGIYRSEDGGETWQHMSDWNPRPMYASQITVDPNDDQRIYMVNSYSWSDDGGRTFTVPRQTLHGDDRLVWVDPSNSDHVVKADDGGIGISWNRGETFVYVTNLPVSQFYRIGLDNSVPFKVCGGLQDNGSWCGPSATYRAEGIINEDWTKWGGGDGFRNVIDTTDNRTLYVESQYLGLNRRDLVTGESKDIRPNQPEGFISPRRNWRTWPDLSDPEERLGNAMPPGNWDGPFIISPHDANTLYAGLNELFVSRNQGDTWTALGDLTTGTDRRSLEIMEQAADSFVLSLDDGIPYWPTLSEIAESPVEQGVLYVGTDDGLVQVSRDGGATFSDVTARVPGMPELVWINGLEPSRHVAGRIYLVANNYRNDDYANYLWVSENYGQSWTRIDGGLPAERVLRTVREDTRNPNVLWLATEFGAFVSVDRGASWTELRGGMPTMAFNDLVIHPRDNDLVLATHSRGIWIYDNINAFQELTPEVQAKPSHLFTVEAAHQIRYNSERGHTGDMIFYGDNPPAGAIIDFWMGTVGSNARLTVLDAQGTEVAQVPLQNVSMGLNRAVWDLRHARPGAASARGARAARSAPGALVVPGTYTVRLEAGGVISEQSLQVLEDPRIEVDAKERANWTNTWRRLAELTDATSELAQRVGARIAELADGGTPGSAERLQVLARETSELARRARGLESGYAQMVGPMSADEQAQARFIANLLETLTAEFEGAGR